MALLPTPRAPQSHMGLIGPVLGLPPPCSGSWNIKDMRLGCLFEYKIYQCMKSSIHRCPTRPRPRSWPPPNGRTVPTWSTRARTAPKCQSQTGTRDTGLSRHRMPKQACMQMTRGLPAPDSSPKVLDSLSSRDTTRSRLCQFVRPNGATTPGSLFLGEGAAPLERSRGCYCLASGLLQTSRLGSPQRIFDSANHAPIAWQRAGHP